MNREKILTKVCENLKFAAMIKVTLKDGESVDRMIKRFGSHIKSRGLLKKFRSGRYFAQKLQKRKVREAAIAREGHRDEAKRKQYMS